MKIYVNPADGVVLTPTGDGSSASMVKSWSWSKSSSGTAPNVQTGMIPTVVSSATEKNKSGSRRTMLKVATTMPRALVDLVSCGNGTNSVSTCRQTVTAVKDLRIQTHLVVECDEDLIRQSSALLPTTPGNLDASGAGQIIAMQLRMIIAMLEGDKSLPSGDTVLDVNGTIVRGLLGLEPLDVVSGEYGQATA